MLKTTPFHSRTAPLVRAQTWRRWAGHQVASSYEPLPEHEYAAVRNAAALFDVSPLHKYRITGPQAAHLLDRMVTRDLAKLAVGQVMYTPWCDAHGKVIDDGTISRLDRDVYRLTSAEPNLRWLSMNAVGLDVTIEDISDRTAALALQGPLSRAILQQVSPADFTKLKYFRLVHTTIREIPVTISRTGYTGDLGYEIWVDASRAVPLWDALIEAGTPYGITPAGIWALDIARIEAGLVMLDVDYFSAFHALIPDQLSSPFELSLDWTVSLDKGPYNGRRALREEKLRGPAWRFVGIEVEWDSFERIYAERGLPPHLPSVAWRTSAPIFKGPKQVGYATSGCWSPLLKKYIALAMCSSRTFHMTPPCARGDGRASSPAGRRDRAEASLLRPGAEASMKTAKRYDAIIVGGGHNGLVAAAYLARAGRKTLVLERRPMVGGAAVTEEIFPGFKFSVFSYVVSLLRPEIIRDLELPKHGLQILPLESTVTPLDNGDYLAGWADPDETRRELERHSKKDAEAAVLFGRLMHHMAMAVRPIISMVPPDPASLSRSDLSSLIKLGGHMRDLGAERFHALHKLMTMSSADYLDEWYEFDPLKATKSASGIIGTFLGPRSPGSAYVLLHHYMGEIDGAFRAWGFQKGGTGAISESIASAARAHGAEVRTDAAVERVIVSNGRATGVALVNGEQINAPVVVSSLDPRRTFLELVSEKELPDDMVEAVKHYKFRGSSGKVNLALSGLPNFTCMPGVGRHLRGAISISPSLDYLERAYDDAKYGEFSRNPYMDIVIPSMIDPGMAPPGKHVMSIFVQYAPYNINGGWTDAKREAFGDAVVNTLARYAPNIRSLIMHRQVLTPADIESITGLSEGNIFQGELALQQLFFLRPVGKWAKYRTPIKGYWQCGAGTHPGGGIMGASGRLAALQILGAK